MKSSYVTLSVSQRATLKEIYPCALAGKADQADLFSLYPSDDLWGLIDKGLAQVEKGTDRWFLTSRGAALAKVNRY